MCSDYYPYIYYSGRHAKPLALLCRKTHCIGKIVNLLSQRDVLENHQLTSLGIRTLVN